MSLRLSADALDQSAGMTLAELAELVRRATVLGCDPASVVKATTTIRGRVKTVELAAP